MRNDDYDFEDEDEEKFKKRPLKKEIKMAEISKRPLTSGQFAWAISKKSGSFSVIFGPDPMDATDDELFVVPSKQDRE